MAMTSRKPSKPWRVSAPVAGTMADVTVDHRSERAAYKHVRALLDIGARVTVHHWEEGRWCLYERLAPDGSDLR